MIELNLYTVELVDYLGVPYINIFMNSKYLGIVRQGWCSISVPYNLCRYLLVYLENELYKSIDTDLYMSMFEDGHA